MDKSINIIIAETKEKLRQVIGQAQLPALISDMIVREFAEQVSIQAQQCLRQDTVKYQKSLQDSHKKAGENNGNKERTGK